MSLRHFEYQRKTRKQLKKTDPLLPSLDATWISSLSQPEPDLLISLKQLAIIRSKVAGYPDLANKFDARILRALGVILLEHFKDKLKSNPSHAMIADLIDKLPLCISMAENINLENARNVVTMMQKHTHDGLGKTEAESTKKQKITVKEEPVELQRILEFPYGCRSPLCARMLTHNLGNYGVLHSLINSKAELDNV